MSMPGRFECTNLGNAERLVAMHGDRIRYVPQRRRWLLWDGRRWAWDETGGIYRLATSVVRAIYNEAASCSDTEVRNRIAKHAFRSESKARVDAMVNYAKGRAGVPVTMSDLDADPWKLNVENGVLDLRTGELRAHDARLLCTKLAPVRYDPQARSELWEQFLSTVTGGDEDMQRYLQRVFGYAIQGAASERAFFCLYGPPGTAKSTWVWALGAMLGDYCVTTAPSTWLPQNRRAKRGDLVRIAGARLVTATEFSTGARLDDGLITRVTDGDPLTCAAKYEAEVTFRPACTLLFAGNYAPSIDAERAHRIPFTAVIPPESQDRTFRGRIQEPEPLAAMLAWAVQGCLDWQATGIGTCPAVERERGDASPRRIL